MAIGEEAEVADAMEAGRQDVQEEPAHELARIEPHHLAAAFLPVVLPEETDGIVCHGDEPAVGDGDAMGVAAEIGQHLLGAAEGRFGVDHPVDPAQRRAVRGEGAGLSIARGDTVGEVGECDAFDDHRAPPIGVAIKAVASGAGDTIGQVRLNATF